MKRNLLLTLTAILIASFANAQLPISKDFNDNSVTSGGWEAISVIGDQVWTADNNYGIDDTPCGKMTGYDDGAFENEDWLISPEINADNYSTITLNFWNTSGFDGNPLEAHYSTDYSGDPATATWTEITGITWHDISTQDFWEWTNSGDIDLSSIAGTFVIGFKYTSSSDEASTWELDDISIEGTASINENEAAEVSIYPNPTSSTITINNDNRISRLVISNCAGQRIMEMDDVNKTTELNVGNFSNGIYFITLTGENGAVKTTRFMKK